MGFFDLNFFRLSFVPLFPAALLSALHVFSLMRRQSTASSSHREDETVPLEVIRSRRGITGSPTTGKDSVTFVSDDNISVQSATPSQNSVQPAPTNELKRGLKARHVG